MLPQTSCRQGNLELIRKKFKQKLVKLQNFFNFLSAHQKHPFFKANIHFRIEIGSHRQLWAVTFFMRPIWTKLRTKNEKMKLWTKLWKALKIPAKRCWGHSLTACNAAPTAKSKTATRRHQNGHLGWIKVVNKSCETQYDKLKLTSRLLAKKRILTWLGERNWQ